MTIDNFTYLKGQYGRLQVQQKLYTAHFSVFNPYFTSITEYAEKYCFMISSISSLQSPEKTSRHGKVTLGRERRTADSMQNSK
uniref:Uncharacterized protein n=1 Tax=Arundo donax TaxID=35708 RepID=A0A0A9DWV8_ARUDO